MRPVWRFLHLFLLSLLIIAAGYLVISPYIREALPMRSKPCFSVVNDAGKNVLILKARVNTAGAVAPCVNLVSFGYHDSLPSLNLFDKRTVQRLFERQSLFHAGCSYERFKKELFKNNIFFWNQVETVMIGIPRERGSQAGNPDKPVVQTEQIDWKPLTDFARYPLVAAYGLERYMFFYPAQMTFIRDVSSAKKFFHDYFLGRDPFVITQKIPASVIYVKIVVVDKTESAVFEDCGSCK